MFYFQNAFYFNTFFCCIIYNIIFLFFIFNCTYIGVKWSFIKIIIIEYSFFESISTDNIIVFLNKLLKLFGMEKFGYFLLIVFYALAINFSLSEVEVFYPDGLLILLFASGLLMLFVKVLNERINNKEDNYYSKEIDK